ncbi:BLUF domain-containing protein [Muriicola soli]|uniref:BLUF domain-containing protein n=1 Tax=Muriicola soli TaxID=2507538 RepID=A0A411E764_9FLAO|nr:BLUF domain-containing protein [Muriicola soli]QBA63529.1 BLUF domain-containing protein [Muriicola soli]
MNNKIFQLTYRSRASEGIGKEQIMEIVEEAAAFNSRFDITGCLVFDQGYFIQILEGEKETINELYKKITKDRRHFQFEILSKGEATDRLFKSWDMGYIFMEDFVVGEKEEVVKKARKELDTISIKNDFTPKVFWYNVYTLLTDSKFYKSN